MKKRLESIFLALMLVLTTLPTGIVTATTVEEDVPESSSTTDLDASQGDEVSEGDESDAAASSEAVENEINPENSENQENEDIPDAIASNNDDIMPVASTVSVTVYFREKNPPFLGVEAENAVNTVYFSMKNGTPQDYNYEFSGPDGESASFSGKALYKSTASASMAWYPLGASAIKEPGVHTLKVKDPEGGEVVCSGTVDIYQVTFNTGDGAFEDAGKSKTYTGYGDKDSRWSNFNLPSSYPVKEGSSGFDGYIGWATESGQTSTTLCVDTVGGAVNKLGSVSDYKFTLYAAYGQKKVTDFAIEDEPGEAVTEVDLGNVTVGSGVAKTLTIKNTGNQPLKDVKVGSIPNGFDIRLSGTELLTHGSEIVMSISPKEGASLGNYSGAIWVFATKSEGEGRPLQRWLNLSMQITSSTQITVMPATLQKEYGEIKSSGDVSVTVDPKSYSLNTLGVRLTSEGFSADAKVGEYDYGFSGGSGYTIVLDTTNKVKVVPAKPRNDGVNATGITRGESLSSSHLSGTFTNPHTGKTVTGTLKWENDSVIPEESGDFNWVFTPDGEDKDNYTSISGTTRVQVGEKTPTTIIREGQTSFKYDGKPKSLTFRTDRVEDDTPIVVRYLVDGNWTEEAPKKAGSYTVEASVAGTAVYLPDTHTETMTIDKAALSVDVNVQSQKVYDGTTNVTISDKAFLYGVVSGDQVTVKVTGELISKDVGSQVLVNIHINEPEGADAANYQLATREIRRYVHVLTKAISITIPEDAPIEKEYGEQLSFTGNMFTAEGLVAGETLADQHVDYASEGAESATKAGTYPVTATIHGGNYTFGRNGNTNQTVTAGEMKVIPTTPVESLNGVTVGEGKQGGTLRDVSLNGTFVNPHDSTMTVEGRLEWAHPDMKLPESDDSVEAEWIFTPNDTDNYTGPVRGTTTVTLLAKTPLPVTAQDSVVTYDGQPHGITAPEIAAGIDKNKLDSIVIEYKLIQDIISIAAEENGDPHYDYSTTEPTEAGIYNVHVHVYARDDQDEYADNLVQVTLIINPAKPDASSVKPEGSVVEGTPISDVKLLPPLDVNGKPLEGTFTWEHPDQLVMEDGVYQWIFTPDSSNYHQISGSVTLTLAEDSRTIKAVVYNLPDELGYTDYVIIDLEKSALKINDEITFFKDSDCSNPESLPMKVSDEDVDKGTLTVSLDADALEDGSGLLYARITSSKKHKPVTISYPAEPGFTVSETLRLFEGDQAKLAIAVADGYADYTVSVTANSGDVVSVEHGDSLNATVTGKSIGSTVIQVMMSFPHPDAVNYKGHKITVSKTIHVAVEPQPGDVEVEVQPQPGAPAVSVPAADRYALESQVLTEADLKKIENGVDVLVELVVASADQTVSTADKVAIDQCIEEKYPGYIVGQYLDISLIKSIGSEPTQMIHDLEQPITLVISVPESLRAAGRNFRIIRVHNGEAVVLNDLDSDPDTITIQTNRFSTYAIAYQDSESSQKPEDSTTSSNGESSSKPSSTASTSPETGDPSMPVLWLLLCLISGIGVWGCMVVNRRSRHCRSHR